MNYRERAGYRVMYPDLTYEEMYNRMIVKPTEIIIRRERKELIKNLNVNPITGRKIKMVVYGD